MATKQRRKHEFIGGPLCGKKTAATTQGFAYEDMMGVPHFYRLIKVAKNDMSAVARFYHYFGNSMRHAEEAHPFLMPPDRLFRKIKRS
jgi:hypothetical protein